MDDTGRDRHETLVRVRPKKVIVKRSIGQEKKSTHTSYVTYRPIYFLPLETMFKTHQIIDSCKKWPLPRKVI